MKTQNPWMGRVRGSAGNMTGCKVYDKNVLRAKAFEVSNPDTDAQRTQRAFFKEVANIVATVSEEELRSLFGIKPKTMSRRNALSKQVAAAYSIVEGQKVVDFSKLQAIGNGQKVTTEIFEFENLSGADRVNWQLNQLNVEKPGDYTIIIVVFDITQNAIKLVKTTYWGDDLSCLLSDEDDSLLGHHIFAYPTISTTQADLFDLPFGSFILKTRSAGKQVEPTPPTLEVTINSNGIESGSFFHFDGSLFDPSNDDDPSLLFNGSTQICDYFQWDEVNNWWFGTTEVDINLSLPLTLNGTINGESVTDIQVDWVVQ